MTAPWNHQERQSFIVSLADALVGFCLWSDRLSYYRLRPIPKHLGEVEQDGINVSRMFVSISAEMLVECMDMESRDGEEEWQNVCGQIAWWFDPRVRCPKFRIKIFAGFILSHSPFSSSHSPLLSMRGLHLTIWCARWWDVISYVAPRLGRVECKAVWCYIWARGDNLSKWNVRKWLDATEWDGIVSLMSSYWKRAQVEIRSEWKLTKR